MSICLKTISRVLSRAARHRESADPTPDTHNSTSHGSQSANDGITAINGFTVINSRQERRRSRNDSGCNDRSASRYACQIRSIATIVTIDHTKQQSTPGTTQSHLFTYCHQTLSGGRKNSIGQLEPAISEPPGRHSRLCESKVIKPTMIHVGVFFARILSQNICGTESVELAVYGINVGTSSQYQETCTSSK